MARRGGPSGNDSVLRMRIHLSGVQPVVWRRVLVSGAMTMAELSTTLLSAMGWQDSHPHTFRVADRTYGPSDQHDEEEVTVLEALENEVRFIFNYDFGDGWSHEVLVEEVSRSSPGLKFAVCLDGENACPPEDVGGVGGYAEFLLAILDPDDLGHDSYLEWHDGPFDPDVFDLAGANARLQRVRRPRS